MGSFREKLEKEREQQRFMAELFENYQNYMFYVARQFVDDAQACEDIVQDGLVKLLGRIELLQSLNKKALASYLYKTIKNLALDYLEAQQKERAAPPEELEECTVETPESLLIAAEDQKAVARAWAGLSDVEAHLLERKYADGLSNKELAAEFGIRVEFVSMKVIRAKKKLAKLLQREEENRGKGEQDGRR
ncbi:MAG: sigma-70 family RNA polymerase sigma factor [Lachnospiraceae bacterium]|nr:sigma-70 family RNA polymerase sigma factor [Lachnospiraceae bacterium]